ncbi:MAG: diguanylate cyclase [Eubacterium sp.]|nr:diguanylate cyclase [Eubacterium sp.]
MKKKKRLFSVKKKMNLFVILTVFVVALGSSAIAFGTSVYQIDSYYRQIASDNAKNFASMVDGDFLGKFKTYIASDEYQKIRDAAEEAEDEAPVEQYLKKNNLWNQYYDIRTRLTKYIENIENLKYLYVVAHGGKDATQDMYLIDDESTDMYETGYYEGRETELLGVDLEHSTEPRISNGDWGWLCSAFYPVYDSQNRCVCVVGCDFDMEEVMQERFEMLMYLVGGSLLITIIVAFLGVIIVNKVISKPLNAMTQEMKKFNPSEHSDYKEAGVINLDIKSNDEIGQIYRGIRSMQTKIVDYIDNLSELKKDKKKAESYIKDKEEQIDKLSEERYKDALTRVGNKAGYIKKAEEINQLVKDEHLEYAVAMIDMNNLKLINDDFGHKSGDLYIKGCCKMICETFKHSPVYRIGGDEFVAILLGKDYKNRIDLVKKLKDAYKESYIQENTEPWLRYSAAVGFAEHASDDYTIELVFKRADKAMYEDKAAFKEVYGSYR